MSIRLTSADDSLKVSAWTWGTLHAQVDQAGIFPSDIWESTRYNCGAELDPEQVTMLADCLEAHVLARLGDGERLLADGTVTGVPDDLAFHRDDLSRNYGASRPMLERIVAFLRAAPGPVSFD